MKITAVDTFLVFAGWRNWVFVRLQTDQGIEGVGEGTLEGKERAVEGAIHELRRYLVGTDPRQIEAHCQAMYAGAFWRGGVVLNSAISAVEQAMWDILGKSLEVSVYQLLGGACRDRIRVYANGWFGGAESTEDYAQCAAHAADQGYTALKWDPFGRSGLFLDEGAAQRALECVALVREAVGPEVDLLIEVHGRLSPAHAIRMGKALEPYDIFFYEEPVPPEDMEALAEVGRSLNIPIATGERLYTKFDYARLLRRRAVDIIQPDPCHAGGILEMKEIAAMAEANYVRFAPHNPNGPIATAACLHLAACTPNFLIQETLVEDVPWRGEVATEPLVLEEGGFARLPEGPGLGVELDEEACRVHPYQSRDLTMFDETNGPRQGR
jgi:galactonate dehydratase